MLLKHRMKQQTALEKIVLMAQHSMMLQRYFSMPLSNGRDDQAWTRNFPVSPRTFTWTFSLIMTAFRQVDTLRGEAGESTVSPAIPDGHA